MQPAIPAATLILLRDSPDGPPEIPMVGRGAHLAFAASRLVFPGGRIDPDDLLIAERPELIAGDAGADTDELAHRIAAIRETIEEIGLAPAVRGITDVAQIVAIRTGLHDGKAFSLLLESHGFQLELDQLVPFARWLPNHPTARRFDTRFYIGRAPAIGEAIADGRESSHCVWGTAEQHLAAGELMFPTIRNLERVGLASDFDDAAAFARSYPIRTVTPRIEPCDEGRWFHIPDDLGYPVSSYLAVEGDSRTGYINPSITRTPG